MFKILLALLIPVSTIGYGINTQASNEAEITNLTISQITTDDATLSYDLSLNGQPGDVDYRIWQDVNNNNVIDEEIDTNITLDQDESGWNEFSTYDGVQQVEFEISSLGYTSLTSNTTYIIEFRVDGITDESDIIKFRTDYVHSVITSTRVMTSSSDFVRIGYTIDVTEVSGDIEYRITDITNDEVEVNWTDTPDQETTDGEYQLPIYINENTSYKIDFRIDNNYQTNATIFYNTQHVNNGDNSIASPHVKTTSDTSVELFYSTDSDGAYAVEYQLSLWNGNSWQVVTPWTIDESNVTPNTTYSIPISSLSTGSKYKIELRENGVSPSNEEILFTTPQDQGTISDVIVTTTTQSVKYEFTYSGPSGQDILYTNVNNQGWQQERVLDNGYNEVLIENINTQSNNTIQFMINDYYIPEYTYYVTPNMNHSTITNIEQIDISDTSITYKMTLNQNEGLEEYQYSINGGQRVTFYSSEIEITNLEPETEYTIEFYADNILQTQLTFTTLETPVSYLWLWLTISISSIVVIGLIATLSYVYYDKKKKDKINKPWKYV